MIPEMKKYTPLFAALILVFNLSGIQAQSREIPLNLIFNDSSLQVDLDNPFISVKASFITAEEAGPEWSKLYNIYEEVNIIPGFDSLADCHYQIPGLYYFVTEENGEVINPMVSNHSVCYELTESHSFSLNAKGRKKWKRGREKDRFNPIEFSKMYSFNIIACVNDWPDRGGIYYLFLVYVLGEGFYSVGNECIFSEKIKIVVE